MFFHNAFAPPLNVLFFYLDFARFQVSATVRMPKVSFLQRALFVLEHDPLAAAFATHKRKDAFCNGSGK